MEGITWTGKKKQRTGVENSCIAVEKISYLKAIQNPRGRIFGHMILHDNVLKRREAGDLDVVI